MEYASTYSGPYEMTSGCIKIKTISKNLASRAGNSDYYTALTVDASSSNPIYGNSETVTPLSTSILYVIKY